MQHYHDTHHARVLARINRDIAVMTENESAAEHADEAIEAAMQEQIDVRM